MIFHIVNVLISQDEDIDLKINERDLTRCTRHINKELKTFRSKNPCLTVSLRFTSVKNMKELNSSFSGVNKETNVLSFAPDLKEKDEKDNYVGDVAICVDILKREAKHQNKDFLDHLLHVFVHGVLHLLGYAHGSDRKASEMEALEKKVLKKLGIEDPYQIEL